MAGKRWLPAYCPGTITQLYAGDGVLYMLAVAKPLLVMKRQPMVCMG